LLIALLYDKINIIMMEYPLAPDMSEQPSGTSAEAAREDQINTMLDLVCMTTADNRTTMELKGLQDNYDTFRTLVGLGEPLYSLTKEDIENCNAITQASINTINDILDDLGGVPLGITDIQSQSRREVQLVWCDNYVPEADAWVIGYKQGKDTPIIPAPMSAELLVDSILDGLNHKS
jgi:hypothetical protein